MVAYIHNMVSSMRRFYFLFLMAITVNSAFANDSIEQSYSAGTSSVKSVTNVEYPENRCSTGSAMDQWRCFEKELESTEDAINKALAQIIKNITQNNQSEELIYRLDVSQEAWLAYRDAYCLRDYVRSAPVHPPSQSLTITMCKLKRSESRLSELQNDY